MGSLTGDFAGIAKVIAGLSDVAKNGVKDTSIKAAANINELVEDDEFELGVDPYGRSWAPLKDSTVAKGRTPPPLTASGKMRGKAKAVPGVKGIKETIPFPAPIHQHGSKNMAARPIVPYGVLPPKWSEAVERAGAEVISSKLKLNK